MIIDKIPPPSPPPKPKVSSLNGAIPTQYDSNWQTYTDLSLEQITWFQAQPEWLQFLDWVSLSPNTATINADVTQATISTALAASALRVSRGPSA